MGLLSHDQGPLGDHGATEQLEHMTSARETCRWVLFCQSSVDVISEDSGSRKDLRTGGG
jgi:hypothetical protein